MSARSNSDDGSSPCCVAEVVHWLRTPRLSLFACRACGTLWPVTPLAGRGSKPWSELDITPEFARALATRRSVQADKILQWAARELRDGPVLDYGCGQGLFVERLLSAGIDAFGCDVASPDSEALGKLGGRFAPIRHPWASPDLGSPSPMWGTIALMDVLEHHPAPSELLRSLPESARLLVKVPLRTGPLARVAVGMARVGHPALLEGMFLVDDVAPHQVFFSAAGLISTTGRAGWVFKRMLRLADVGAELPERMRGFAKSEALRWVRPLVRFVGAGIAASTPLWSDTAVFSFERACHGEPTSRQAPAPGSVLQGRA